MWLKQQKDLLVAKYQGRSGQQKRSSGMNLCVVRTINCVLFLRDPFL